MDHPDWNDSNRDPEELPDALPENGKLIWLKLWFRRPANRFRPSSISTCWS
jgi:hypothetical protein